MERRKRAQGMHHFVCTARHLCATARRSRLSPARRHDVMSDTRAGRAAVFVQNAPKRGPLAGAQLQRDQNTKRTMVRTGAFCAVALFLWSVCMSVRASDVPFYNCPATNKYAFFSRPTHSHPLNYALTFQTALLLVTRHQILHGAFHRYLVRRGSGRGELGAAHGRAGTCR